MAKKVMIVDDSAVFRKVVAMHLKNAGYEVMEASDGVDALTKVKADNYNLVICDVNMPNMDGITFVKTVRTDDAVKFLPIIMLTTESQEDKKKKGLEAGAKAWLVKPFSPEQLLTAVSKLIS